MGLPVVNGANYPTPDELRAQCLAELRWLYHRRGLVCNVTEGSENWKRYTVLCNRVCIAVANSKIAVTNLSPLTALGDDLLNAAALVGVTARDESHASGYLIVGVGGPAHTHVAIPSGFLWTSPAGIQYATTGAFNVESGELVEVQAVSGGSETDCDPDVIGNWDSAAIGLLVQTAVTDAAGLTGGHDADGIEDVRRRYLRKLKAPAVGGNSAAICQWLEESSAAIDVAFCYPAVRGPSSYDWCIMQQETVSALSLTVINAAAAYLQSKMPGSENMNGTTTFEQVVDICIDASLPLPQNAGGGGSGWRDAVPWPTSADAASTFAEILSVGIPTRTIVVNSTAADPPVAGKHIAIFDSTGGSDAKGAMVDFVIVSVTPVGPPHYTLVLDCTDSALSFVTAGMLVSAAAYNLSAYALAFRDAMASLGPGEKTASVDILVNGAYRFPSPDVEFPSNLTSRLLSSVSEQFKEVADLAYAARYAAGSGESGTSTWVDRSSPSVPATTAQPPRILKLGALSFRRKV